MNSYHCSAHEKLR